MKKLVLWGIGSIYNKCLNSILYFEMIKQIEIVAITAKQIPYSKVLDGYSVVPREELVNLEFDLIIVMNDKQYESIVQEAVNIYGINRKKIVSYRVLQLPGMNFDNYIKLKEKNISIISNNCWGGIIYYTLCLECLSPFKNLFLKDEDYLKVLNNLKYYMDVEPELVGYDIDSHSLKRYPILLLDDIEIHCNHDDDYLVAINNWQRRKKKINYNNIFVEMYTENKNIEREFSNIEYKKICFVPWDVEYRDCMRLNLMPGQSEFWETVNGNAGITGLTYDLIELLLHNNVLLR